MTLEFLPVALSVQDAFCKKTKFYAPDKNPGYRVDYIPATEENYNKGLRDTLRKTTVFLNCFKNLKDGILQASMEVAFIEEPDNSLFCSLKSEFHTTDWLYPRINAGFSLKKGSPIAMFESIISNFIDRYPSIFSANTKADLENWTYDDFVSF